MYLNISSTHNTVIIDAQEQHVKILSICPTDLVSNTGNEVR